ncbi:MAG: FecR domain-containing protein [Nitrospirae bacterium]|nr:FecR domain-containing protein [Nitrospirota bacterium]
MKSKLYLALFFAVWIVSILIIPQLVSAADEPVIDLKIVHGDTLENITKKYVENWKNWLEVAKFNKLQNPHLIYPNMTLKIPVRLLRGVPMDGTASFVSGEPKIRKNDKSALETVRKGDVVKQGCTIQTNGQSSVEITFTDKNSIFLKPNTILTIQSSQTKADKYRVHDFYLAAGQVINKVKAATGTESRDVIRTSSAVAAARGTEFRVSADAKAVTRMEVLESKIEVEAMNKSILLDQGFGTQVKKGAPPEPPRKLLPSPVPSGLKEFYNEFPVNIAFENVKEAAALRVVLAKDPEGKDVVAEKVIRTGEPFVVDNASDGGYMLLGQSVDRSGIEGPPSKPYPVKVRTTPYPPSIEFKPEDKEVVGKIAQFKWLKVNDAVKYHVQISKSKDFKSLAEDSVSVKENFYKTGSLEYGDYVFRIASIAKDGYQGGWSRVIEFRLIPPPPAPEMAPPKTSDKTITIAWRAIGPDYKYHFQMSKDSDFKEKLKDEILGRPEISFPIPDDSGTYYIRTSSIDYKGLEGPFGSVQTFEIPRSPYFWISIFIMVLLVLSIIYMLNEIG